MRARPRRRRRSAPPALRRVVRVGVRRHDHRAHRLAGAVSRLLHEVHRLEQLRDLAASRDGRSHRQLRHHGDVAQAERVGRVRDREHERAVVGEADRRRQVALRGGLPEQRGGRRVHRELGEVDVVEPVALRERASQLVLGDRAALEQDLLGRLARAARGLHGLVRHLLGHEPELDEDVAEEAAPGAAQAGGGHSRPRQGRAAARSGDLAEQRVGAHDASRDAAVPSGVPLRRAGADCAEISASSSASCGESASASRWMPYES